MNCRVDVKEKTDIIISKYLNGNNIRELSSEFNCSSDVIRNILIKNNIKLKTLFEVNRIYSLDEKCFELINCESLYWAGIMMSDGCIVKKLNSSVISLTMKDLEHIEKFKFFLKSSHPIYHCKKKMIYTLTVNSNKISKDLELYGIFCRKSFLAKPPLFCSLSPDFWRGMIDGDGTVGIYKNNRLDLIKLNGSLYSIVQFRKFCRSISHSITNRVCKNKSIFCIQINNKNAFDIISKLYSNKNTSLNRKQLIADKILEKYYAN